MRKEFAIVALFAFQTQQAGVAQLVERNLAKVEVAGSSPVTRSYTWQSPPWCSP